MNDTEPQRPYILQLWQLSKPITVWTLFSLAVSIGAVEFSARAVAYLNDLIWKLSVTAALSAALLIPLITIFIMLRKIFQPHEKRRHLAIILLAYLSLIFCFGGSYYAMAALGDRVDARAKYNYYSNKRAYTGPGGEIVIRRDARAFAGIQDRLWTGVDWPAYPNSRLRDEQRSPISAAAMISAAKKPFNKVTKFEYGARADVLTGTLYFSVVNMTTLGFGDITPTAWYSRLAANIQVLAGLILFYFGIAMVIGNWWSSESN